jgi:hypothetical protein
MTDIKIGDAVHDVNGKRIGEVQDYNLAADEVMWRLDGQNIGFVTSAASFSDMHGTLQLVYDIGLDDVVDPAPSPLETQVGGGHYTKLRIQPMVYSMANGLDACQHTTIKYVTRFRDKGGVEDLKKAKHVIDMLIDFEVNGFPGLDAIIQEFAEHDILIED